MTRYCTTPRPGTVYLVGAGPGDPGLISVRGLALVQQADVIVHDQLGAPSFLGDTRPDAELIDVGKFAGCHTIPQDEIHRVLISKARAGHSVVRLKGGDPMVFGRGGEELEALAAAGVPYEVVPGISSPIAGPAYAGIPITHRDCTTALALVTAHEKDGKIQSAIPWSSLSGIGTIVFLMGVKSLPNVVEQLIAAGKSAATPVAIIERATSPQQRTVVATLESIVAVAARAAVRPPALIVVGDVVNFRETLQWYELRPLFGRSIVVTRSRAQAGNLAQRLRERGANVYECPTIRIEPLPDAPSLTHFWQNFDHYRYLVFTSVNGVECFFQYLCRHSSLDIRALNNRCIVCIGPATADCFRQRGLKPDFVPETYVAESLLPFFADRPPAPVAILRAETARDLLPDSLARQGFEVHVASLYRTVADRPDNPEVIRLLREGTVDAVTFTSSSTVTRFTELLQREQLPPARFPAVVIGPITKQSAVVAGFPILGMAAEHTIDGLVNTLENLLHRV